MLLLLTLALIAGEIGDVEKAVGIGAVDALGGQGLDVAVDLVLEGDALVERVELVVVVVDGGGVGEVDGEDADALGSCATLLETCSNQRRRMRRVTYSSWDSDYTEATGMRLQQRMLGRRSITMVQSQGQRSRVGVGRRVSGREARTVSSRRWEVERWLGYTRTRPRPGIEAPSGGCRKLSQSLFPRDARPRPVASACK